jgi:hypothetical protein
LARLGADDAATDHDVEVAGHAPDGSAVARDVAREGEGLGPIGQDDGWVGRRSPVPGALPGRRGRDRRPSKREKGPA